ncbi:MAG TPA: 3-oxoacyl-[acyl-carrier-protein] synthase III C-terminal domain-containing protein [Planctomycetota bacterium]|nr:3-oxoacyl-[acyl-carrier-protein] synthase III C-terminal domain-containing protein [Planctomycetota bacterium]
MTVVIVASVAKALPPHRYEQEAILAAVRSRWAANDARARTARLESLHRKVLVGARHLALPLERYASLDGLGAANDAWIEEATRLGAAVVREALERSGVDPSRVGAFYFASVTGLATPSIDARVMNVVSLPATTKRVPIFGLGCVAGAAGIARAADYVKAFPDEAALLLAVELCSLTIQWDDVSLANQIASGLFGDGAAAAVVAGERCPAAGPRVLATRSVFYPDSERAMGWDVSERGFRVVLSPAVPQLVRERLRHDVDSFLADHGTSRREIGSWVCHAGGPRVLEAVEEALELPSGALELTWRSLHDVGNLSSASVLFVLADTIAERRPAPGTRGVLLAMGPGFCSELVLLEW